MGRKSGTQKGSVFIQAGSWCVRWRETITDENGKCRRQRFRVLREVTDADRRRKDRKSGKLRTPDDVAEEVAQLMTSVNLGHWVSAGARGNRSIAYLVEQQYLPDKQHQVRQGHFKPSTLKGYQDLWRLHLRERIGEILVRDFRREHCFLLWEAISKDSPKLTGRTLQHIRTFLSGIFRWALNRGIYIGENPARADLPAGLPEGKRTEAYTTEEVATILRLLVSPLAQALVALAYGGGLRKGELAAVRWEDYQRDEDGATIRVAQSSWNGKLLKPKTEASIDTVRVDEVFCDYVDAYRNFCGIPTHGLMFPGSSAEKPINLDSFRRWQLLPVLHICTTCGKHQAIHAGADHKFERDRSRPAFKGWHGFRRGNATLLASEKNLEAATLMLRHASSAVTDQHYVLTSKQEKRAARVREQEERELRKEQAAGALGAAFRRAVQ